MSDDPDSVPERDMKYFQFRQMKKIRVFDSPVELPKERSSLLAVSNKFGLTFVGQDRTLKVFPTRNILVANKVEGNPNEIVEGVKSLKVAVELPMHNLALSSDELTLAVCGMSDERGLLISFYDVRTLFNETRPEKLPFASFAPVTDSGGLVQDLKWNPVQASVLAACLSDGSMMVLEVTDKITVQAKLPASVGITCVCWSPKGKQVAAGKLNATVIQYTPSLQEKKVIPCPNFYSSDNPVKVLDILWLSTYVFAVVYAAADGSLETPPELVVVSLPKKDEKREERYLNFNDLVYGACTERQHHYFLSHIEDWDIVLAASAGSIEVSIIAKQEDKTNWELWLLEDASRAELPVTLNNDDTLPVGVAIDYTSQDEIRISDDCVLPPAPTLMLLSTDGVLCPFSLVNQNKDVKQLSVAPVALSLEGERLPGPGSASVTRASIMVTTATTIPMATPAPRTTPLTSAFGSAPLPTLAPSASSQTASSSSSSSGFSFALPSLSTGPSFFSIPTTTTVSMGTGGFGTTGATTAANAAFSFPAATKPPSEMLMAPTTTTQHLPASSPAASFKPPPEPATPGVKMNLNGRFLAMDTPGSAPQVAREFSVTSTPKPAFSTSLNQSSPVLTSSKPASSSAQARPAQSSAVPPPTAVSQPAAPKALTPAQGAGSSPSPQVTLAVKAAEKQLLQRKESNPVMAGILEEIAHFQKELDELKARASKADFHVGLAEQMKELRREAADLHVFTLEIKETTESLHGDIGSLKTTLLEGFAGVEEGKTQRELSKDSRYLQLLYKKPLDPRREEQLKEIRRLYQYVKFSVDDVSDMLDLEWERHLENKKKQKHLIVPGREALFTTLANNLDIINQQQRKLDSLVKDLQALRLYNKTASSIWSVPRSAPTSQQGLDSELESLRDTLLKARLESPPKATSESQVKMSPAKQHQLRNFLSKRQTPPVRSTAPANLSRSAFLSPNYYEGLDDGSSTSSLSQVMDPEDPRPLEEEVSAVPHTLATARHPAVVRTSSVQPGFGIQGPPFVKAPAGFSSIVGPTPGSKINLGGADSTAFATKTVKHGAPPMEKTTPVTVPPQQAAATAALRRQMANQKPGTVSTSLTESTLKTVPQVVNVQELKDKGPAEPVSTVISASVPASAAQVVQQMLAATATNQAKRNSTPGVKVSASTGESSSSSQPIFVFGGPPKPEAPPVSPASTSTPATVSTLIPGAEQTGKVFTFSAMPAGGFNFSPLNATTLTSHGTGAPLGKDVNPSNKFSFAPGSGSKLVFAPEAPFSLVPKSTSPVPASTGSPVVLASGSGEPAKAASASATLKTEPQLPKSGSAGETLGSFSGLRVGQGDDEPREAPKPAAPTSFSFGPTEGAPGTSVSDFSFGGSFRLGKPAEPAGSAEELASGDLPKTVTTIFEGTTVTTATPSAGVFKPPEPAPPAATKSAFSVTQPEAQAPASSPTSFADLLAAPLAPPAATDAPSTKPPVTISETPAVAEIPKPAGTTLDSSLATPFGDVVATQSSSTQAVATETTIPATVPEKPLTPPSPAPSPVPTAAQNTTPLVTPPQATQTPTAESVKATESAVIATPVTAPAQQGLFSQALVSEKPGSIFAQPVVSTNSTTPGASAVAPVISTAAPVTTPAPSLGSTAADTLPTTASVFGQPASSVSTTTTTTTTTTSSGFGSSGFVVGNSGFGKPVFGQVAGFGQPAASTSGGFGFGQPAFGSSPGFGQPAAPAPASSGGSGLFGSSGSGSASSFSFGQISGGNSSTPAGTGLFGQGAAPNFGQQSSGFGQASVFGSSAPTTTSSAGFGFGQPSAFGSTSTPLFGQQTGSGSVFGQSATSGGGLFGPGASSAAGTTAGSGGFFSGLGGKPSEDAANKNPFGSTTTDFGRSNQAGSSSLFGNSGAKTFGFGASSFSEQKPGGSFSTGSGSVASQGFGSFGSPSKPGGFGSAPVFGSPPAFGGSPAFGTASAFGSSPSFSNPMGSPGGKVFGEGTAAANVGGFGFASASTAPTFGSLATQTTPSFGNLATQGSGFGGQTGGFSGFGSPAAFTGNFGSTNQTSQTFGGWRS